MIERTIAYLTLYVTYVTNCCMAQAVSRRPAAAEVRVRALASLCGICGGQRGTGTVFSASLSVFPCHYLSSILISSGA
jgi:hypothetical protein